MISIIYVEGRTLQPSNYKFKTDCDHDWWLLIQTHSTAYFVINKETIIMPPHTAILYPPHVSIEYGAENGETYSNDWIRFYTDEAFIYNGIIPLATPFKTLDSVYISQLFYLLAAENFFQNKNRELSIRSLFHVLFSKLNESFSSKSDNFLILALHQLHQNIQTNPGFPWTVSYMAKLLHVCPRHLHKMYHEEFGISCNEDVINNRLLLAKSKLETTTLEIHKIAELCGYSSIEHFSRQFKKQTDFSPKKYRELNHKRNSVLNLQ